MQRRRACGSTDAVPCVDVQRGKLNEFHGCQGEVILAAGAIKSPHLLLLSGIGPGEHLRAFGVPVVHDFAGVGGD